MNINFYYNNSNIGPGKGFGNLDVSNHIYYSNSSRKDNKEFKENREGCQAFDYQFQYLDKNFQDPNHIVMPIPRGGVSTRDRTQLFTNINLEPKINFKY